MYQGDVIDKTVLRIIIIKKKKTYNGSRRSLWSLWSNITWQTLRDADE